VVQALTSKPCLLVSFAASRWHHVICTFLDSMPADSAPQEPEKATDSLGFRRVPLKRASGGVVHLQEQKQYGIEDDKQ
jgi:hypothetical protein